MWSKDKFLSLEKKKILKELYQLASQVDQAKSIQALDDLKKALSYLDNHQDIDLRRLSQQTEQISKSITDQQIYTILVGLEHLLQQSVSDAQFLSLGDKSETNTQIPLVILLENLRSAFNVGSIFRTAEFFSAEEIILCGYTPTPEQKQTRKSAMGADEMISWRQVRETSQAIRELKEQQYQIIALETSPKSEPLDISGPTALLVGNEKFGLSQSSLHLADQIYCIKGQGRKNSLNVGSAFAIAACEISQSFT